ncbi:MAG TPA: exosortase/archaeosortase family protein [Candidatus Paceibacterota bacterium]|nr:exosortase/archaeosortase family protein [Candidatus Paceibacterota bacterium]
MMKLERIWPLGMLLPAWLAMGWLVSQTQWFWNNRPDLQFGWVVLLLCLYLFWESWEKRPAFEFRPSWGMAIAGLAGAGLAFLVQIYQAAFGINSATTMGLALAILLLVWANLTFVFGWRGAWHFAMPFGFILIALPLPGMIYNLIVGNLQSVVTSLNVEILSLAGVPAQRVGSLIQLPNGVVGVDEACSGIRSLQSAVMATLFIGYVVLRSNGLRVLLLAVGILLAFLGNVIRSLMLSFVAYRRGLDALDSFHDTAGWSILGFTVVGVMFFAWLFGKVEKGTESHAEPPVANPAAE